MQSQEKQTRLMGCSFPDFSLLNDKCGFVPLIRYVEINMNLMCSHSWGPELRLSTASTTNEEVENYSKVSKILRNSPQECCYSYPLLRE